MAGKQLWQVIILLASVGFPLAGWSQEHTVIPLVPAANWHLVSAQPLTLDAVRDFGGDPTIDREYGVKTVVLRKYHLGEKHATVLLEEAMDPSAAFGLFTYYRSDAMEPAKEMQFTLIGHSGAMMVRGPYFIRAWGDPEARLPESDLRALLIFIGGTRPTRDDAAALPNPLPPGGLVPGSEKYLLGLDTARRILPNFRTDLIGFNQGAEVLVGTYALGQARSTVVAINYPTPQIARVRYGAMESFLGINQDRGHDTVYGRRNGSFVILVLDAGNSKAARGLIDQFQVASNVSWNEPAPKHETFVLQVVQLVLANLLLSFIIAGFAVGGGVLIFLGRRAATRFFPQWTWADTEHETIIRLNIGSQ